MSVEELEVIKDTCRRICQYQKQSCKQVEIFEVEESEREVKSVIRILSGASLDISNALCISMCGHIT
ncbi:hypothetical protein M8J77_001857 [Diaphorina citri]|nr:hypothetical protein M8J77_001857 [Diaphorina citri]